MSEKSLINPQHRNDWSQLVVPLDMPRTMDNATATILSGVSGQIYTVESGKRFYIHEMLITNLSGDDGWVQIKDKALSGLCVPLKVEAGATVAWQPCGCPCGPIYSGALIDHNQTVCGEITLLVQVDPAAIE